MTEFNYSLCLPLDNLSGGATFYRIADYDPEQRRFTQATYGNTTEAPLQIYSPKNEGINNSVELRKWIGVNERKQRSAQEFLRFGYIYEVIFLDEIIHQPLSEDQLRQVLYRGVEFPEGLERYFLLVLDVTSTEYKVLLCDKNAFQYKDGKYYIEKQVRDLKNTITEFNLLYIYNDELITTERLRQNLTWYNEKIRYFHDSIIIPEGTTNFQLRNPEDYTVGFMANLLNNGMQRLKYTKQARTNLLSELEIVGNNKELADLFFKQQVEKYDELSEVFIKNTTSLVNYINKIDINEREVFLQIIERNSLLSKEYEARIEAKWMSKANQKLLEKEDQLSKIEEKYNHIEQKLRVIEKESTKVRRERDKLRDEISELIDEKFGIEDQIEDELKKFQTNIVEQYKLSALSSNGLASTQSSVSLNTGILGSSPSDLINVENHKVSSMHDVYIGLKYNLENYLEEEDAISFAISIIGILYLGKIIILPEYQSEGIANAISLILTGEPIQIINVINNDYDLNAIIDQIDSNPDTYILIKGHLDLFNQTAVNTLLNNCNNKKMIFTINDDQTLNLYSNNIWNYFMYINPMDKMNIARELFWKKSTSNVVNLKDYEVSAIEISTELLENFKKEPIFTFYIQEELVEFMRIVNGLYKNNVYPMFQLNSILKTTLTHQLLAGNRERLTEYESYFINLGIDSDTIKFYK